MSEVTELKKNLTKAWRELQDNSKSKKQRSVAYENVIGCSNEIRKIDKSFALNEKMLEKFSEYKSDNVSKLDTRVRWTESKPSDHLEKNYDFYVSTALSIVSKRLPHESRDSDKFGTIVNATIANLIQIELVQQLNELTSIMSLTKS